MSVAPLHSDPGAPVALYLDFGGAAAMSWNGGAAGPTPAFAGSDAQAMTIYRLVAEKFSPFNVDVTTVPPPLIAPGVAGEVLIGGAGDWYGGGVGGISYTGSFQNGTPVSFVFSDVFGSNPQFVGDAVAHEAGHLFGLNHQCLYGPAGVKTAEYNTGDVATAPIMGNADNAARGLWWNGPSEFGPLDVQDDIATISGVLGRRPYSHAQTIADAEAVNQVDGAISTAGVIVDTAQRDVLSFATAGGAVTLVVDPAAIGGMLHARLTLKDGAGRVLADAESPESMGQAIDADLPPGTYYAVVESFGGYGDLGQYTLSVSGPGVPEPDVLLVGASLLLMRRRKR